MTNKKLRSGFTLIEVVAVFLFEVFIMTMTVGMLFIVFDARSREQESQSARNAAPRLAEQFRTDIHKAEEINVDGDKLTVKLPGGESTSYTQQKREFPGQSLVRRTMSINNQSESVKDFTLPDHSTIWFSKGADGLYAMNIWTEPTPPGGKTLSTLPDKDKLNSFTREAPESKTIDLRYSGNWRTIIARSQQR